MAARRAVVSSFGGMRGGFTVASDNQVTAELLGNVIDVIELKVSNLKAIHPRCRRWSRDADAHLSSRCNPTQFCCPKERRVPDRFVSCVGRGDAELEPADRPIEQSVRQSARMTVRRSSSAVGGRPNPFPAAHRQALQAQPSLQPGAPSRGSSRPRKCRPDRSDRDECHQYSIQLGAE